MKHRYAAACGGTVELMTGVRVGNKEMRMPHSCRTCHTPTRLSVTITKREGGSQLGPTRQLGRSWLPSLSGDGHVAEEWEAPVSAFSASLG